MTQKLVIKSFTYLLLFLLIVGVSFLTLRDSLKLALSGDDWLLLYTIRQTFEVHKSMSYLEPRAYLCTYCPPHAYLSLIKHFWGYNPFYYYLVSIFVKIFSAISITFLIKKITNNLLTAFLSGLLFAVSYVGIQTTDWVFNLNHYAGVGCVSLFLVSYFHLKENPNLKNTLISSILFASSLIISPPRMHGLLPLVIILEIIFYITEGKSYQIKLSILRIIFLLVVYKLILSSGGYGTEGYLQTITSNLHSSIQNIKKGNIKFITNPIATLGNFLLTDKLLTLIPFNKISYFGKPAFTFFTFLLPIWLLFITITNLIFTIYRVKLKTKSLYIISAILWILVVFFLKKTNTLSIEYGKIAFLLTGGLMTIFSLFLFYELRYKNTNFAQTLLIGFFWMLTFSIFPWLLAPYSMIESWSRYAVQQSAGLSIWIATILSLAIKKAYESKKIILVLTTIVLTIFLVITNIFSTQSYIKNLIEHRSEEKVNRLWNKIILDVPQIDKNSISIFYLSYDDYYTAEWGLRFGFSSRAAIYYDIREQKNNPYLILDYNDLVSIATDGKAMLSLGLPPQIIPIERIYSFDLRNGNLTNTTKEIRQRLQYQISKNKNSPKIKD